MIVKIKHRLVGRHVAVLDVYERESVDSFSILCKRHFQECGAF